MIHLLASGGYPRDESNIRPPMIYLSGTAARAFKKPTLG